MNFFEQQDRARTRTGLLVLLYALAVLALVAATCALVAAFFGVSQLSVLEGGDLSQSEDRNLLLSGLEALPAQTVAGIFAVITSVVVIAAIYKLQQLSAGGAAVAEALGGRLLNVHTRDANEKKLLNVVEEMAIAAG
ncbi:MAG: peptidase, partial [Gammaproteobacteria bacterium]|nr:peptidase [Gammaproteobacteria bacterium]